MSRKAILDGLKAARDKAMEQIDTPESAESESNGELGVIQDSVSSRARPYIKKEQNRPNPDDSNSEPQTGVNQDTCLVAEVVVMEQVIPTEDNLPTVGGHSVKLNEWSAFQTHALTGSVEEAARAGNVTPWSIWRWRRTDWWRQLHLIFIEMHLAKFHEQMAARADEIHDAYFSVMGGEEKYGKTANAVIQGCKIFMQSGADPILKSKPVVEVQNNTQTNILEVGSKSIARFLSKEDLNHYARTGQISDDARRKAEAARKLAEEKETEALASAVVKSTIPFD